MVKVKMSLDVNEGGIQVVVALKRIRQELPVWSSEGEGLLILDFRKA